MRGCATSDQCHVLLIVHLFEIIIIIIYGRALVGPAFSKMGEVSVVAMARRQVDACADAGARRVQQIIAGNRQGPWRFYRFE